MTKPLYTAYIKLLIILLTLMSFSACFGQINYGEIKTKISDNTSPFYYTKLLERFNNSDSTLTKEDFTALYYGAVYLPSYSVSEIDRIEALIREANFNKEFLRAYELADSLISIYPVSLQAYFEKAFASFNLKRFDEEVYNNKRYRILARTIMNSGDGKSLATAWHANLPNDEYEVIRVIGSESKEETEFESDNQLFDLFELKSNKEKRKKVFFNVTKQRR